MEYLTGESYASFTNEMPDKQPPAPSYPEPGQQAPMNPNPDVPRTDAPEVETGTRMEDDLPAQETDENEVGEIESQNPWYSDVQHASKIGIFITQVQSPLVDWFKIDQIKRPAGVAAEPDKLPGIIVSWDVLLG